MRLVMKKLSIEIPEWRLQRHFQLELLPQAKESSLLVRGCDINLNPYSMFTKVTLLQGEQKLSESAKEPFKLPIPKTAGKNLKVKLEFQGHYNEPKFIQEIDIDELKTNQNLLTYMMVYNPFSQEWEFCVSV